MRDIRKQNVIFPFTQHSNMQNNIIDLFCYNYEIFIVPQRKSTYDEIIHVLHLYTVVM